MRVYTSCNCRTCKTASSAVRGEHKKQAHRALRQAIRLSLLKGREMPGSVSTGYKK
jgi:hypothetical protein